MLCCALQLNKKNNILPLSKNYVYRNKPIQTISDPMENYPSSNKMSSFQQIIIWVLLRARYLIIAVLGTGDIVGK